jgi:hypothetical protein
MGPIVMDLIRKERSGKKSLHSTAEVKTGCKILLYRCIQRMKSRLREKTGSLAAIKDRIPPLLTNEPQNENDLLYQYFVLPPQSSSSKWTIRWKRSYSRIFVKRLVNGPACQSTWTRSQYDFPDEIRVPNVFVGFLPASPI